MYYPGFHSPTGAISTHSRLTDCSGLHALAEEGRQTVTITEFQ